MKEILGTVAIIGIVAGVVASFVYDPTPTLYVKHRSQLCTKVIPASAGTCTNPPEKFTIVWVSE